MARKKRRAVLFFAVLVVFASIIGEFLIDLSILQSIIAYNRTTTERLVICQS